MPCGQTAILWDKQMNYIYKCEACKSVGEMEDLVPSVECPVCGGNMHPEKGAASEEEDMTIRMSSAPIKIAKAVNIGFSGMLKSSGTGTDGFLPARPGDSLGKSTTRAPAQAPQQNFQPPPQAPANQAQQNKFKKKTFSMSKPGATTMSQTQQRPSMPQAPNPAAPPPPQQQIQRPSATLQNAQKPAASLKFKSKNATAPSQTVQSQPAVQAQPNPPPQNQFRQQTELQNPAPQRPTDYDYQRKILESASQAESAKFAEIQRQMDAHKILQQGGPLYQAPPSQQTYYAPPVQEQASQHPPLQQHHSLPSHAEIEEKIRKEAERMAQEKILMAHLESEKKVLEEREKALKIKEDAYLLSKQQLEETEKRIREEREKAERIAAEEREKAKKLAEEEREKARRMAEDAARKAAIEAAQVLAEKLEKEKEERRKFEEEIRKEREEREKREKELEKARKEREELEKRMKEMDEKRKAEAEAQKAKDAAKKTEPPAAPPAPKLEEVSPKIEAATPAKDSPPADLSPSPSPKLEPVEIQELTLSPSPSPEIKKEAEKKQEDDKKTEPSPLAKSDTSDDVRKIMSTVSDAEKKLEALDKKSEDEKKAQTTTPDKSEPDAKKAEEAEKTGKDESKDGAKEKPSEEKKQQGQKKGFPPPGMKKGAKGLPGKNMPAQAVKKGDTATQQAADASKSKPEQKGEDTASKSEKDGKNGEAKTAASKPVHGVTHTGLIRMQLQKKKTIMMMIFGGAAILGLALALIIIGVKSCRPAHKPKTNKAPTTQAPVSSSSSAQNSGGASQIKADPFTPLQGEFKKISAEIKKMPMSKEGLESGVKLWHEFIDKHSANSPDDFYLKKAKEEATRLEDLKAMY